MLVALLLLAAISAFAAGPPEQAGRELGATIARKLRCAPRLPGPCWRDPLTEAYGRPLAGLVRALAPQPLAVAAASGLPLMPVDFRYCRRESCAVPGERAGLTAVEPPRDRLHLGRRPTPRRRRRSRSPTGSTGPGSAGRAPCATPSAADVADARLHAAARDGEPPPGPPRDPARPQPLRLPGGRGAAVAVGVPGAYPG